MRWRPLHNPGLPVSLTLAGLELEAFSISGLATYVLVPALDACFDLGHCGVEAARLGHVFLSHVHQDHAGGVHRHLSLRAMTGARPPRIYCPAESAEALRDLLRAWARLEGKDPAAAGDVVVPVRPGDRLALGRGRTVEAFDVTHRIASRGYTVVERARALLPAWQGRPAAEVSAAVRRGEAVHAEAARRRLTYIGDSTIETLEQRPEVSDCDVLLMEATHLPGTEVATARRYGHTHLDELVALFARAPAALAARHIVLKHFSLKYREDDVARALAALPDGLRERVTMLAP
ncbi:MAG: MBL fold metallo-hydrolase [Planctomycetes bacterium]|nr:MBL fold metallo-hydrolase [Planctomycetota bacterium]